ncbi:hypothetical protein IWZ03DRAFT_101137 [Phyllosticta citriasiana]|uniref:Secreted protein n=1 Tax=Phyllosticta citriasiana TaxID=595635 RepID=A0ABR1KUB7_9PEZI
MSASTTSLGIIDDVATAYLLLLCSPACQGGYVKSYKVYVYTHTKKGVIRTELSFACVWMKGEKKKKKRKKKERHSLLSFVPITLAPHWMKRMGLLYSSRPKKDTEDDEKGWKETARQRKKKKR